MFTFNHGEYYSGMVLGDFVRLFKELRVIEGNCNVAILGRVWSKGKRGRVDLKGNTWRLVEFMEKHEELHRVRDMKEV